MVRAWASRIVLKVHYKSFLIYLKIAEVATEMTKMGRFAFRGPASLSENSDLGSREKSKRATERHFRHERLWL